MDRERVEFLWEKFCGCCDYDSEFYEQQLLNQFQPMLRGLVFKLRSAIGWLFPSHDIQDYFVLAELSFVLAVRDLAASGVSDFLRVVRRHTLCILLKLLRSEFEFSSSVVWEQVVRGGAATEQLSSAMAIIHSAKIEDLLAPTADEDDEPRDELWLSSSHRDLDPAHALELRELAQEIWSGLCAGELRIPERWQQGDELIAFLRECGLQVGEKDYKRMLRRNKARRLRAQSRMDEESQS